MCTNCGKSIGFLLDNQKIEKFISPFVTNMVFQNISLFWIIQLKETQVLIFKSTVLIGYLISHGITLQYFHDYMVQFLKTILKLKNVTNII